jgi:proline utilization trans-activator
MDGEHAFSAALTLVMVNVAFPYNERDASALETSLSILRGMAQKGNEYIQARLSLLLEVLATIGRQPYASMNDTTGLAMPNQSFDTRIPPGSFAHQSQLQTERNFQPFQDVSLDLNLDNDPTFWEELSGNIDIDMATGWMETALRGEAHHHGDFPG